MATKATTRKVNAKRFPGALAKSVVSETSINFISSR